ncbi:hypothetical protein BU24DRAFT_97230 [Aaosphaeria arxii CBS 175.79]|uniref:Uncharacterized protein n=1 Tax=Aaosphaeria arxii CBS 175.79 TaxID=1450172 RepID=A0A6A5X6G3_9PLEO|nr:uncharacterized protein BU24DRAFT_97230 [Aaosphaeria arxii CBS 175.79]KAF2008471.1 hypothetical protein BU24DRAFT_97230 [Aaosphaeria arxii CBS 175.79]
MNRTTRGRENRDVHAILLLFFSFLVVVCMYGYRLKKLAPNGLSTECAKDLGLHPDLGANYAKSTTTNTSIVLNILLLSDHGDYIQGHRMGSGSIVWSESWMLGFPGGPLDISVFDVHSIR